MKSAVIFWVLVCSLLCIAAGIAQGTLPTFRNELGEVIPVIDWGQPGVDFEDLELIGCFKVGSLTLPQGTS
jgi:hypothetical protein